jgi:hypothetical protein
MAQSRVPAGIPTGGQFAPTNRPEATGVELVDDEQGATERDPARRALLEIEQLGARRLAAYERLGRVAAALPASARAIVVDHIDNGGKIDSRDATLAPWADLAMRRAIAVSGQDDDPVAAVFSIANGEFRTDLERAARYHVRQALSLEDVGDTDWVCPTDPSHATLDGTCVTCGVTKASNHPSTEQLPVEALEPNGEDADDDDPLTKARVDDLALQPALTRAPLDRPDGSVTQDHVADGGVPTKAERVLRELVSELYRLQNEADEGYDDDMASAFDRAAEMLEVTIDGAFSGPAPAQSHIDPSSIDWTVCGKPDDPGGEAAQLLGTVTIGKTPFRVLALQVDAGSEVQRSLQRDDDLGAAMNALGDQEPYETVEIKGRPYVLLLSPHAR